MSANTYESGSPFRDSWKFPDEVKKSIGAHRFTITETGRKFKSGRNILHATFFSINGVNLSERTAMQLVSKTTGKPYHVVSVDELPR